MGLTKIGTDGVKDDAITKAKIPANQIENSELAVDAVNSSNIVNGAVDSDKIADATIGLDKLVHGTSSNDGKFLRANNGADPSFETVSIPAGTTINNNGSNRIITGSSTSNTLEGESTFTYNGTHIAKIDTDQTYAQMQLDGSAGGIVEFFENGTRRWEIYGTDPELAVYDRDKGSYHTRFKSGGNLELTDGDLKISTSGHELFADYEIGEWHPVIRFYNNGTWSDATMTTQGTRTGCHYVKIGNMCFFHLGWDGFEVSNSSYAVIGGLPFGSNGRGSVVVNYTNLFNNHQDQGGHISAGNGDQMEFYRSGNNWNSFLNNASGRYIYADGFYKVI